MILRLNKQKEFKQIIELIKANFEDIEINIKEKNIELTSIKKTQTTYIKVIIEKRIFEKYEIDNEEKIGISTELLYKSVKNSIKEDIIIIEKKRDNILTIRIENEKNKKRYNINLQEIQEYGDIDNKMKRKLRIKYNDDEIDKICKEISGISEVLNIKCDKEEIIFGGDDEFINCEIKYEKEKVDMRCKRKINNKYNMEDVKAFTKISKICDKVIIDVLENDTLKIEYDIKDFGTLKQYISAYNNENEDYEEYDNNYEETYEEYI